VSPGQGRIHECLVENKDELSEECHVAEFEQLAMQSIDIRLSPTAMRACKSDMGRLCSKAMKADGGMWRCLEDNMKSLRSHACKKVVLGHEMLTNSEFHLNPVLVEHCQKDAQRLCQRRASLCRQQGFQ